MDYKGLILHFFALVFFTHVWAEELGYFLILRIKTSKISQFNEDFKTLYSGLEDVGGKLQAIAEASEIKTSEGTTWPKEYGVAILYFPTEQGARDWMNTAEGVKEADWLGGVDAILIEINKPMPGNEQGAFLFVTQRITDKDFFFRVYVPAAGPAVVEFGGAAGVSGPDVSFEWETLRGSWIPKTPEDGFGVFYAPTVQKGVDLFASDTYAPAKALRQNISDFNIYIFPRELKMIPEPSSAISLGMHITTIFACFMLGMFSCRIL